MKFSKMVLIFFLVEAFLYAGCQGDKSVQRELTEDQPVDPLVGVWLKPIEGNNGFDGLQFDADGRLHYLNMFTIMGDSWQRIQDNQLDLSSHTSRYPIPQTDSMIIQYLDAEKLILVQADIPDALAVVYQKAPSNRPADRMLGRWNTMDGRFFDVTPVGQEYRIVEQNNQEFTVMKGQATAEGMMVETPDRLLNVVLVPGSETGRNGWLHKDDCVRIEDVFYLCR